jgi:hypothetical protein
MYSAISRKLLARSKERCSRCCSASAAMNGRSRRGRSASERYSQLIVSSCRANRTYRLFSRRNPLPVAYRLWGRGGHLPPSSGTLWHIWVIALRIIAVIPVLGRGRRDRHLWPGLGHNWRVRIRIRIGIVIGFPICPQNGLKGTTMCGPMKTRGPPNRCGPLNPWPLNPCPRNPCPPRSASPNTASMTSIPTHFCRVLMAITFLTTMSLPRFLTLHNNVPTISPKLPPQSPTSGTPAGSPPQHNQPLAGDLCRRGLGHLTATSIPTGKPVSLAPEVLASLERALRHPAAGS